LPVLVQLASGSKDLWNRSELRAPQCSEVRCYE